MKALSIKQPWASLIVGGAPIMEKEPSPEHPESYSIVWKGKVLLKDIENRNWSTNFRGRIYIHAAKRDAAFDDTFKFLCERIGLSPVVALMAFSKRLPRGAIIGEVDIVDCVTKSKSRWFVGKFGLVLRNPVVYKTIIPYRGQPGFFEVLNPTQGER